MKIKKAYEAIVAVLEANLEATVESVLPEVLALAAAKTSTGGGSKASTFHRDEDGNVVAIFCYYHKLWMDPRVAEFGKKATSATGLNNMCKDGVSKWTKQNSTAKKAEGALLAQVAAGEIAVEDIPAEQARIAEEAGAIIPREDGYGFETLEECLQDSAERGIEQE